MAKFGEIETVVTKPVRVNLRSVDKELAGLWRMAAEGGVPGVSAPISRVLVANLLVYASSDEDAGKAAAAIEELAASHPTRAVVVDAQPGEAGRELDADVSVMCSIGERGRRLCGEEVRLHAHGLTAEALGTIMPVLEPDLPVYLWTPGDLTPDHEVFANLAQVVDHWIIDSRRFTHWTDSLDLVTSLALGREPPVILHDLSWIAISQLREMVAQLFDPQLARDYLRGVTKIEIVFKPSDARKPAVEAVMLAAWLISRLGWQRNGSLGELSGTWTIPVVDDGRQISILLQPRPDARLPLEETLIESELDGRTVSFRCAVSDRTDEVALETVAPDLPGGRRTLTLDAPSLASEVGQALDAPGSDRIYHSVYPIMHDLMRQIEARA
jgi:glucose-6-phosphate dehydrogenase assembly protein OpcA